MPFTYYAGDGSSLVSVLPDAAWSATRPFVEEYTVPTASRLSAIESTCPRVWLIASHYGAANGPASSRKNYTSYQNLRQTLGHAYPRHTKATFGWASPVRVQLFSR
jgi:hypothetical protein